MKKALTFPFPLPVCGLLLAFSCGNPAQRQEADDTQAAHTEHEASAAELSQTWKTDSVFTGSESTLYDSGNDVIYVSCGNTAPWEKDGNGFIAVLNRDGSTKSLKWVEGLHAPKGMALLNGKLYVTDVDQVRVIDVEKAALERSIPVEGAQALNDLATDGEMLYFSDSKAGKIYSLDPSGNPKAVVEEAPGINGLECHGGNLYSLEKEGLKKYTLPDYSPSLLDTVVKGGDGLVILDDSSFVASRWIGEIYFIGGGETRLLLDTKEQKSNTADIGYIPSENTVIVPTFMKNEVVAFKLQR